MKIVFRTDASLQIGAGHVMRCLTLAVAMKASGAQCLFICREHPGNLIEQIQQRGFAVFTLPADTEAVVCNEPPDAEQPNYAAWLGTAWTTDAAQTQVGAGDTAVDWLIVDHYALDARWEETLRPIYRKLMVIDDLANRPHACDLLLDQNLGRNIQDYSKLVPKHCTVLAGPHYALLRPEFAALRDYSLRRRAIPQLGHLLIAMGGVDQANATGQVLEALKDCALDEGTHITVVMGPHAPWLEQVQSFAAQMPQPTQVKVDVQDMAQLMADSDLAIGAAGSTSWERCCLGLPSIIGVLAENQRLIANALQKAGAAKVFGIDGSVQPIRNLIDKMFADLNGLSEMIASAAGITDGTGTDRVVLKLEAIAAI
jgi:UDP-2,4-diacetamido-2,4,6-trideoxy-beta-L-altropyranose hydrolase